MRIGDVVNYVVAAVLVAATIPMYRYLIERANAPDSRPVELPAPVVEVRREAAPVAAPELIPDAGLPLQSGSEGGVRCAHGFVYRQTHGYWLPVAGADGQASRCEIRVEPVRPGSS